MTKIVGVKFKESGKTYVFDSGDYNIKKDYLVIVETVNGKEIGKVDFETREARREEILRPLKKIIRIATKKDRKQYDENLEKQKEAEKVFNEKIKVYKLDIKLIEVQYNFDRSKLSFYFLSEDRVDFRELVKDLASIFRTRIELRQVGVRDEVKRIGGNGMCGRELCCVSFLKNFESVSIKQAKEQNLSLNPTKISGACGRLMCCLNYEQNVYDEKLKRLPKVGAIVKTEDGNGEVVDLEILKEIVKVKIVAEDETHYKKYKAEEITIIKNIEKEQKNEINEEESVELKKLEALTEEEKEGQAQKKDNRKGYNNKNRKDYNNTNKKDNRNENNKTDNKKNYNKEYNKEQNKDKRQNNN